MRDWDEHRLVLAIHRGGTLRAAADHLGVTHTTVSRRLSALEEPQSSPLFVRSGRAYKATDYGMQRVAIAEQIEALDFAATRLDRSASSTLSGPLSLSVPQAFLQYVLMDDIAAFIAAHPDIELTVAGSDAFADLDRGQADVVLRGQINPSEHLVGRKLYSVGLNYYANPTYLAQTPREKLRWLHRGAAQHSKTPSWIERSPYPEAPIGLSIDDIVSLYKATVDGLGLGRLACFMADPNPRLIRLDDRPPEQVYDLWVLTHPDLRANAKVKALMNWLADALKPKRDLMVGAR